MLKPISHILNEQDNGISWRGEGDPLCDGSSLINKFFSSAMVEWKSILQPMLSLLNLPIKAQPKSMQQSYTTCMHSNICHQIDVYKRKIHSNSLKQKIAYVCFAINPKMLLHNSLQKIFLHFKKWEREKGVEKKKKKKGEGNIKN